MIDKKKPTPLDVPSKSSTARTVKAPVTDQWKTSKRNRPLMDNPQLSRLRTQLGVPTGYEEN